MAVHEFTWREWITLFRQSRILINDEQQLVTFENCVIGKSFWSLLPIRSLTCRFDEISNVATSKQFEYRCISLETPTAKGNFLDSDVPRFDELVQILRRIAGGTPAA